MRQDKPLTPDEEVAIMAAAGLLTEHEATCWVLRKVEGRPGYAVAEDLGISQQAVSNAVKKAEAKIENARDTLEAEEIIRWQAGSPPEQNR